jgi:hypothetical protein
MFKLKATIAVAAMSAAACAAAPDYMVVDLRAWKTARFYQSADKLPGGGVSNPLYKTDYIAFRKIPRKDWYIAMNEVTPAQASLVTGTANGNPTRADVIKAMGERTGLSVEPATVALPSFEKFNPVVPAREAAQMFSRAARRAAAGEKPPTWLSGKVGVCVDFTGGAPADAAAFAARISAIGPDYVALRTAGELEAAEPLVSALAAKKMPVMMVAQARTSAAAVSAASRRFGKSVFAWWFDGASAESGYTSDLAEKCADAARAGNAEALVAFNPGEKRLHAWFKASDFTAGEVKSPFVYTCFGPLVAGSQWHAFVRLGADAQAEDCRYDDSAWMPWMRETTEAGGAVTLVAKGSAAGMAPEQEKQLARMMKSFRRAGLARRRQDAPALASASSGRVLRVDSAKGKDDGNGSSLRPFRTIERAKKAVRDILAGDVPAGGVTVEVTGRFDLAAGDGVDFGSDDGGPSPDKPVVWTAGEGGALFTGAFRLPAAGFKPVSDKETLARIREPARGKVLVFDLQTAGVPALGGFQAQFVQWDGMELFADGKVQTVARYPDKGWLEIEQVYDRGVPRTETRDEARTTHADHPGSFQFSDPEHLRWDVSKGVYLKGYWCHDWASETLRVAKIESAGRRVTLEGVHRYGIGSSSKWVKQKRRYMAYNFLEVLDSPGEWFIDHEKRLLYYYPPSPMPADIALSYREDPIVSVKNAKNLVIRNWRFKWSQGNAVSVSGCKDVVLDGLDASWFARGAISVHGGARCTVANCSVSQIGGGGVTVSGGSRKTLTPCAHRVTGCEIHHCGRLSRCHGPCLAISGCGVRVDHNELHDSPYIVFNYTGNDHVIEYNEVYCAMMEGADGGGLYTGRDWSSQGNVLRYNYFHHFGQEGVKWEAERGLETDYEPTTETVMVMGVYLDDCDSGDSISNNVFFKAGWAMFVGGGRDNKVHNNLFADCTSALHLDTRGETWNPGLDPNADPNGNDGWNLAAKLAQWNYKEEPWASRYPNLAKYLTDSPKSPIGTEYVGNVAIACREFFKHDKRALELVKTRLRFEGNRSFSPQNKADEKAFPQDDRSERARVVLGSNKRLEKQAVSNPLSIPGDPSFRRVCPDFPEIPVSEIGRKGAGR